MEHQRVNIDGNGNIVVFGNGNWVFARRRPRDARTVADLLAEAVERRWAEETRQRRLEQTDPPLPVLWTAAAEALVAHWETIVRAARTARWDHGRAPESGWAAGPQDLAGDDGLANVVLLRIPTCRLVLLGGGGAGKTSLLAQTSLHILSRRRSEPALPVPVIVPLATWNPELRPDLWRWMAERIAEEYLRLDHQDVDELRTGRLILPILDGLDEIADDHRAKALECINEALSPGDHLVLSCRTPEYEHAVFPGEQQAMVLSVAAGVELRPIPPDQVADFLFRDDGSRADRWTPVLAADRTPAHVTAALSRPLTIDLARTVYNRRAGSGDAVPPEPEELLGTDRFSTAESITEHLFDSYLPAAYAHDSRWRPAKAQRWLRFIATHNTPTPGVAADSFEWWCLRETVPRGVVGMTLAALPAAAVGLVAAVNPKLGSGLGVGLLTAQLAGAALLFVGLRRRQAGGRARPTRVPWRLPTETGFGVGAGIAGGFVGGALGGVTGSVLGILAGVQHGATKGIVDGLGVSIGAGAVYGPWRGMLAGFLGSTAAAYCVGFWPGVPAGLLDGVGALIMAGLAIELKGTRKPAQGLAAVRLAPMLTVALVAGPGIGLALAARTNPVLGALAGLTVALCGGYATGVEGNPADLSAAVGPRAVLARDRRAYLLVAVLGGVSFATGAAAGVNPAVGLAGGFTVGVVAASIRAGWAAFLVARGWHAARGRLPWRLMRFLHDAHAYRRVLRQVGAGYQFRHVELERQLRRQDRDLLSAEDAG